MIKKYFTLLDIFEYYKETCKKEYNFLKRIQNKLNITINQNEDDQDEKEIIFNN